MRQAIPMTCCLAAAYTATAGDPLRLHPGNPHYFQFHGRPTVIVTSGEHYGAVLNRDFDRIRYLKTLEADGMNGTRLFTGAYCEPAGAFHIAKNTLAPAPGRLLCPWARTDVPGSGGRELRRQLRMLKEFITRFDFVHMAPNPGVVQAPLPDGVRFQALAEPGRQYAVYLYRAPGKTRKTKIGLALAAPVGMYRVQWVHPKSGRMPPARAIRHSGGLLRLNTPIFEQDLAVSVTLEARGE